MAYAPEPPYASAVRWSVSVAVIETAPSAVMPVLARSSGLSAYACTVVPTVIWVIMAPTAAVPMAAPSAWPLMSLLVAVAVIARSPASVRADESTWALTVVVTLTVEVFPTPDPPTAAATPMACVLVTSAVDVAVIDADFALTLAAFTNASIVLWRSVCRITTPIATPEPAETATAIEFADAVSAAVTVSAPSFSDGIWLR